MTEDPRFLEAALSYAWLIATTASNEAERRSALEWANRANQMLGGGDPDALDVLAAALAAGGDFENAEAVQLRAMELGDDAGRASREAWLARYRSGRSLAPTTTNGGGQ